jgi:hypothetical protein
LHSITRIILATALVASTIALLACTDTAPVASSPEPSCGPEGALNAEIYGGIRASINWGAAELDCQGMPRPAGAGARLRFAGATGDGPDARQLAFILALPDLEQGEIASELPTNVTVIEEGAGRFFGTRGASTCWTDVAAHEKLPASSGYRISGLLYCVAPLADVNGNASITFAELTFTGRLDWDEQ